MNSLRLSQQRADDAATVQARIDKLPDSATTQNSAAIYQQLTTTPTNRSAAVQAAFATEGYMTAQLAHHFQLHYTSVSQFVKMQ